ncbi:MAG: hypothetical protein ACK5Z2_17135 [Bacteroidota bacterium]|jgi:hypothetical protein
MSRESINSSDILNKINGDVIFTIHNKDVTGELRVDGSKSFNNIFFDNVVFYNDVLIYNIDKFISIGFFNCEFHANLRFESLGLPESGKEKAIDRNISINNCKKVSALFFERIHSINISINTSKIDCLNLSDVNCLGGKLEITNCQEIVYFDSINSSIFQDVLVENNTILSDVFLSENEFRTVTIQENDFKQGIYFNQGNKINQFEISNNKFRFAQIAFSISTDYVLEKFDLSENKVEEDFKLFFAEFSPTSEKTSLRLCNNRFLGRFICMPSDENKTITINDLKIEYSGFSSGEVNFSDIIIEKFSSTGYLDSASRLIFNKAQFQNVDFDSFTSKGVVQYFNCMAKNNSSTKLKIKNSVLGDMQFRNSTIDSFSSIEMSNTDLSLITISPIPHKPISADKIVSQANNQKIKHRIKNLCIEQNEDNEAVNSLRQERDIFRQLKLVCEKSGDRTGGLYYKSYEMRTLHRELIRTKRFFNANRLLLTLSRTNSYGQNYWWPILWAFLFTAIFYIIIFTGISPQIEFKVTTNPKAWWESIVILCENFPLMFKMLNPVYDLTRFPGPLEINSWVWPFEYLHKLTLAFFIFQTISAFRKFVK